MSGVMAMFHNMFGNGQQQQQQQQGQQQGQQQNAGGNTTVPTGVSNDPAATDPLAFQAGKTVGGESPMANYADLWKIEPNQMPRDPIAALTPNFTIDPAKVAEAAKTIDYSRLVPPDLMTKALSGDAAAMGQILNTVTQASTANSGMSTARIVQAALEHQAKQFAEILPQEVRKLQVSQQVQQDNPIFSDPAAAPILDGLRTQFTAKYPTASPQQVSDHIKQYLGDFIKAAGGNMSVQTKQTTAPGEQDWSKFFSK